MLDLQATAIASQVLCQEGLYLDNRDWSAWLDLYAKHAVFWLPAWRNEYEETADPDREVSLIYHDARAGLEERVMRIRSRKSVTAMPLPRTTHFVSNVAGVATGSARVEAKASWMVNVYDPRTSKQTMHFGRYEVALERHGEQWLFARKKIHLQNDCVAAVLDFYML